MTLLQTLEQAQADAASKAAETAEQLAAAEAAKAEADRTYNAAREAKAEFDAMAKRASLAEAIDVHKKSAEIKAGALNAADKAKRDADKAKAEAEAEFAEAVAEHKHVDLEIAKALFAILGNGEAMSEAEIKAALVKELPPGKAADELDFWLAELLQDKGNLIPLFNAGDVWVAKAGSDKVAGVIEAERAEAERKEIAEAKKIEDKKSAEMRAAREWHFRETYGDARIIHAGLGEALSDVEVLEKYRAHLEAKRNGGE